MCDVLMEKSFVIYKTPIGPLKLEASDEGICAVKWLFGKHSELPAGAAAAPPAQSETNGEHINTKQEAAIATDGGRTECKGSKAKRHLQDCQSWLDAYFAGTLLKTNPPKPQLVLPHTGAEFFHSVWSILANTGVGETVSYKELARLSGNPNAARAVGQAVKKHCLPILIPCHRVVKSGYGTKGAIDTGNYSGGEGPATKEWLLKHEKMMLHRPE